MPYVRFTADFDFKPRPAVTQAFRVGEVRLVTTACAVVAEARGKAVRCDKPKGDADGGQAPNR